MRHYQLVAVKYARVGGEDSIGLLTCQVGFARVLC